MAEPLLRVEKLVRRFGGIIATDHVSLDVASGELHAIIGPNGAGKTTLISQLTGQLLPHSGAIRLAGALLANNTDFVSPAVLYWTRSGDLMVMVILGGMGSLFGPVIGAIVYLMLEEFLSQVTEYWALFMGPLLLLIVLFGRGGIVGLLGRLRRG